MRPSPITFDPHARVGDIAVSVRAVLQRSLVPLAVINAGIFGALSLRGSPAALSFLLIAASSMLVLMIWGQRGIGVPIIPMLALQNLIIYGLPIILGEKVVLGFPSDELTLAGREVLICNVSMIAAWRIGMEIIPSSPPLCFALQGIKDASPWMARMGLTLVIVATGYQVLDSARVIEPLIDLLPAGSTSILAVLVSAASACGFFLAGMMIGSGILRATGRIIFWSALAIQCIISASGFLLSAPATVIFASVIGLFWGSSKIPWRFLLISIACLAFLNLGKFTMREHYWHTDDDEIQPSVQLIDIPRVYTEWADASVSMLTSETPVAESGDKFNAIGETDRKAAEAQSLFSRIDTLQNLLFVVDTMRTNRIAPLGGATYSLIPPLLVPRVLWPNKPRSHEGQIMLNVYFGRQDLSSTFQTYIAWGLLPEAYGNFGPITGAIVLGVFLGAVFAWVERYVAQKLLLSMEGFLSFTVFLGMANSFEMVASVLVTSLFQACIPVVIASTPFVERLIPKRPNEVPARSDSAT